MNKRTYKTRIYFGLDESYFLLMTTDENVAYNLRYWDFKELNDSLNDSLTESCDFEFIIPAEDLSWVRKQLYLRKPEKIEADNTNALFSNIRAYYKCLFGNGGVQISHPEPLGEAITDQAKQEDSSQQEGPTEALNSSQDKPSDTPESDLGGNQ